MRKLHEKSIVLGIGIGMIITAIAGMIFSAGTTKELSKAEIMSKAKLYGMIEKTQFLNGGSTIVDSTNVAADSTVAAQSTAVESATGNSAAAPSTASKSATGDSAATQTTAVESDTANSTTVNANERNIVIKIKTGIKAQALIDTLFKKGVISSKEDFKAVLDSYKASTKIIVGTYTFKKNDDLHYIVNTICKLK